MTDNTDIPPNSRGAAEVIQADKDLAAQIEAECVMVDYDYLGFDEDKAAKMIARHRLNHRTDPSPAYQVLRDQ